MNRNFVLAELDATYRTKLIKPGDKFKAIVTARHDGKVLAEATDATESVAIDMAVEEARQKAGLADRKYSDEEKLAQRVERLERELAELRKYLPGATEKTLEDMETLSRLMDRDSPGPTPASGNPTEPKAPGAPLPKVESKGRLRIPAASLAREPAANKA